MVVNDFAVGAKTTAAPPCRCHPGPPVSTAANREFLLAIDRDLLEPGGTRSWRFVVIAGSHILTTRQSRAFGFRQFAQRMLYS